MHEEEQGKTDGSNGNGVDPKKILREVALAVVESVVKDFYQKHEQ